MWECKKCHIQTNHLEICWGISGGKKVDVIDIFCPHCITGNEFAWIGTKEEKEAWWDEEWSK